jgi:hypothetical protein
LIAHGGYHGARGTSEASPGAPGSSRSPARPPGYQGNTHGGSGAPGFTAGAGWDAVTGLGTPANAVTFVAALTGR